MKLMQNLELMTLVLEIAISLHLQMTGGAKQKYLNIDFLRCFQTYQIWTHMVFFSTNNLQQEGTPLSQLQSSENPTQREENFLMMMKVGMMMNTVMKVLRTTEKRKDFNPK